YVVPTGRVKVPAGRYVVPTGKDNVIVSAGRTKVIPAALRWILEEIHVTLAHLEKKRTRLRLNTKSLEEIIIQTMETASTTIATTSKIDHV
ncbi:hypothetical protein Tco_1567923, partial [Tanacetum coccineum]